MAAYAAINHDQPHAQALMARAQAQRRCGAGSTRKNR